MIFVFLSPQIFAQNEIEKNKPVNIFHKNEWKNLVDSAKTKKQLLLVQCGAEWCLPCKQMEKYVFTDAAFMQYATKNLYCSKMEATAFDDINLLNDWKVEKYPTTLFFNNQGKEIKRLVGFQSAKIILNEAEKIIHPKKILLPQKKVVVKNVKQ